MGLAAIQIVQRAGGEVFATAGSPEKREYLKSLGIRHVMDSRSLSFAEEIREITGGEGVDIVLNSLAGEAMAKSLGVLKPFGRFLEIGRRDAVANNRLGLRPFQTCLSFHSIQFDQIMAHDTSLVKSLFQEVMSRFADSTYHPLPYRTFPLAYAVHAFQYMQQSRHIGKIVISMHEQQAAIPPRATESVNFRDDATYLITGGLDGFGLAMAQWMVDKGARSLILVGRGGASSPEAVAAVEALRDTGAQVLIATVDVSKEKEVAALLTEISGTLPPLHGIFHATLVLDDGTILELNQERLNEIMAPQMLGAWNLHIQTLELPLDFFVLFSSFTSLLGNGEQGNDTAAGAFLDALAHLRRAQGRPGLTINWGVIGGVGCVERQAEVDDHLLRLGLKPIEAAQALTILGQLLVRNPVQVGVFNMDWQQRAMTTDCSSPKFLELISQNDQDQQKDHPSSFQTVLATASPQELEQHVTSRLRDRVAGVLGTASDKLDADKPLAFLGLDSLMAVELRILLEADMGAGVPMMNMIHRHSINDLCSGVVQYLSRDGERSQVALAEEEEEL
ncbi:MAG: SDR family NAD(P)-dependent oxidoreductase [Armatimonadota bacterium]|nr:SDR family NAD(P)-dependent oxidoreductase [Armatimonadota bacterium]